MASAADSCMTPPSCPVSLTWPSDLEVDILLASTTIVSPPTLVQASPTATPTTPRRPASSDSNLGCPRTSSISFKSIIYRLNLDPVVFFLGTYEAGKFYLSVYSVKGKFGLSVPSFNGKFIVCVPSAAYMKSLIYLLLV